MDPQLSSSLTAEPDDPSENSQRSHVSDRQATQQAREQVVGQRPGTLTVAADALAPRLFMISYDTEEFIEHEYASYDELLTFFQRNGHLRHWAAVLGAQAGSNRLLDFRRQLPGSMDLPDKRKTERSIGQHQDTLLQPFIPPNGNFQFIPRVDPVGQDASARSALGLGRL